MTQDFQVPRSNRVGSRTFRRRLVVATYGGWLLIAVTSRLFLMTVPGSANFLAAILPVLIANSMVSLVWLTRRTYLNREVLTGDAGLDERLVQNRNQAFRRAYQLFGYTVLAAWPLSWVAMGLQPGTNGFIDAFLIYCGVLVLAVTLPTVVWAWREPDPAEPEPSPV
jgi:FtsH-binding integral membrane protein